MEKKPKSGAAMQSEHLRKVKGYVKNDIKEDKALLKENIKINKALHRKKK